MKDILIQYGLSEKEIEIYIAALKLGNCTASKLSEITDIRRSTVYEIIETLKKKGLINSFTKNKKIHFRGFFQIFAFRIGNSWYGKLLIDVIFKFFRNKRFV